MVKTEFDCGNKSGIRQNFYLFQDKFAECKKHLNKAKKVLLVTHGSDHRVVTDTLASLLQQLKGFSAMMTNGSAIKPLT